VMEHTCPVEFVNPVGRIAEIFAQNLSVVFAHGRCFQFELGVF